MLSSKISHTVADILQPSSVVCGELEDEEVAVDRNEDLDAAPVRILGNAGDVELSVLDTDAEVAAKLVTGSTSTTRNTALPSRTLRTLSASQSPREVEDEDEDEEWEEDPVKASQKALPNLRKTVWLAMAASIACSFWDDDKDGLVKVAEEDGEGERGRGKGSGSEAPAFGRSRGEMGGEGYAEDGTLCFPDSRVESVLPYPDEGGKLGLGDAEKK